VGCEQGLGMRGVRIRGLIIRGMGIRRVSIRGTGIRRKYYSYSTYTKFGNTASVSALLTRRLTAKVSPFFTR